MRTPCVEGPWSPLLPVLSLHLKQYGYVTMFAVAFPLAPLLALIRCLAEIYIDHQKLVRSRRPPYVDRLVPPWASMDMVTVV